MSDTANDNIMGFIPKNKYVQITYWLLLAASAGSVLISLLSLVGVIVPLGGLFTVCGLAALVLALLGFFVFKSEFSSHDQSHLMYLAVLFAVFFVVGLVVGSSFFAVPMMLYAVSILVGLVQLLLAFTGYNSWGKGRTITKDNIKSEVQLALKRA